MIRRLAICILFFTAGTALGQRFLTLPDLSALTTAGNGLLSVDPRSGFVYATGGMSQLSGVKIAGLARLSPEGIPDLSWRPSTRFYPTDAPVFAPNGNLYFVNPGVITSLSTAHGSEPVTRFSLPIPADTASYSRLLTIAGGYDHWLYFSVRESVGIVDTTRVGRLDTRTHVVDSWSYELPATSNAEPTVGADGSVYLVTSTFSGGFQNHLVRLSNSEPATQLWRRELFGPARIVGDVNARVYAIPKRSYSYPPFISRFTASGDPDLNWLSQTVNQFVTRSKSLSTLDIATVADELIVTVTPDPARGKAAAEIARFDSTGRLQTQIKVPGPATTGRFQSQPPFLGVANNKIYYTTGNTVWAFDTSTLQTRGSFSYALGVPGETQKILALPDGGRLIFGRFDAIYGGHRYRDLIRTDASGNVVQDWQVDVDGVVSDVFVTPRGVVVSGYFTTINGMAAPNAAAAVNGFPQTSIALVSLNAGASVDPTWGAPWPKAAYYVAHDGADRFFSATSGEWVNYQNVLTLNALSLKNNTMGTDWAGPFLGENVFLSADRIGGLWLLWEVSGFGSPDLNLIERRDFVTRTQTANIPIAARTRQSRYVQSSRQHAYIGDKRYSLAAPTTEDSTWLRRPAGGESSGRSQMLSANYLYWTQPSYENNVYTVTVRRSALAGNGDADADWSPPALGLVGGTPFTAEFDPQSSDDVEYVATQGSDRKFVSTRSLASEDKTVVEYFNRDVQRYFLTGRADEQALLNANPASFVRTGMTFAARSALYYADQAEIAVCRFYASPATGGSNTHFYGTGDDCPALNTTERLRFEGFDFAVVKPSASGCPNAEPNPVTRLFNNKGATNKGNHRYVVSAATKAKMLTQGWIDEGAVFCSATVTDAVN